MMLLLDSPAIVTAILKEPRWEFLRKRIDDSLQIALSAASRVCQMPLLKGADFQLANVARKSTLRTSKRHPDLPNATRQIQQEHNEENRPQTNARPAPIAPAAVAIVAASAPE